MFAEPLKWRHSHHGETLSRFRYNIDDPSKFAGAKILASSRGVAMMLRIKKALDAQLLSCELCLELLGRMNRVKTIM